MASFNLLIATVGRPTLVNQLRSLVTQLTAVDCLTVVFDGTAVQDLPIFKEFACEVSLHSEPTALGHWGHGIRNKYASLLKRRDFVLHGDDDDTYAPTAFELLRSRCSDVETLYVAQMRVPKLGLIPKGQVIKLNDIGTPCGIVPFDANQKSTWMPRYGGDGEFYLAVQSLVKQVVFLNALIYFVRS